jgi:tape measure domain-containing protein
VATSNTRDVTLQLSVETDGAENLRKLAKQVSDLAKEAGAAAPDFSRISDELEQLASQSAAVETLVKITTEVEATAAALNDARGRVDNFGKSLLDQQAASQAFKDSQIAARGALDETRKQINLLTDQIRDYKITSDVATKGTDDYKQGLRTLQAELARLRNTQIEQQGALDRANISVKDVKPALQQAAKAYNEASAAAARLGNELTGQNDKLNAAKQAVVETGIATGDLDAAQQRVRGSLNAVSAELTDQTKKLDQLEAVTKAVAAANDRATLAATRAAQARDAAASRAAASEKGAADAAAAAALKQQLAQQELSTRLQAVRDGAVRSQQALEQAFGVTGVRSARAINTEIAQINTALGQLARNADVSGGEFDRAFASGQQRIQALQRELQQIPGGIGAAGRATGFLSGQIGQLAAAYTGLELAKKFIDANVQIETLRRSLTLILGSTDAANTQIGFLQQTAEKTGLSVGDLSQAFVNFNASLTTVGTPLATTQRIFAGLTNAAGQLGLGSEKVGLQLNAVAQIANKGKVSLEELQGQLGESLPGALSLTARSLGITEAQLTKLIESGGLLAEEFLPAFARGLETTFGGGQKRVEGLAASINRLKNLFTEFSQRLGDTGAVSGLQAALSALGVVVATLGQGFNFLFDTLVTGSRQLLSVVTGDFEKAGQLGEAFIKRQAAAGEAYQTLISKISSDTTAALDSTSIAQQTNAKVTQQATTAVQGGTIALGANATAQQQTAFAAQGNATAQAQVGAAASASGLQAQTAAVSWTQLAVRYLETAKAAEQAVRDKKKLFDATKLQGEIAVQVAQLTGNETQALITSADAADKTRFAAEILAQTREKEQTTLIAYRDSLLEVIRTTGEDTAAKRVQIDELNRKIESGKAEVELVRQQAAAAKQEAVERQVVSEAYRDNSARLDELRLAADGARASVEALRAIEKAGFATQQQVADADLRNAQAQALYRDALNDTAAAANRKVSAIQRDADLGEATLRIDLQRARTAEIVAQAQGNEAAAIQAKVQQKQIEIRITEANVNAALAESKAIQAAAEAERAALEASGALTPAKQAEIDARLANAKAKQIEAEAGREVIRGIEAEIQAIQAKANAQTQADQQVAASKAATGLAGPGNSGPVDATGTFALQRKLQAGTLSASDLATAQAAFDASSSNLTLANSNPGAFSFKGLNSAREQFNIAQRALEITKGMQKREGGASAGGLRQPDFVQGQPSGAGVNGASFSVTINLGSTQKTINTASQADAQGLVALMQSLGDAANRTGP